MGAVDNSDQWQYSGGSGGSTLGNCHAYNKWVNWGAPGWRNLTTAAKQRFTRPPNTVTDLAASVQPNLWVNLTWTAVADAPGQGAHHYNVYRSSQGITQATKPYATRLYKGVAGLSLGSADPPGHPPYPVDMPPVVAAALAREDGHHVVGGTVDEFGWKHRSCPVASEKSSVPYRPLAHRSIPYPLPGTERPGSLDELRYSSSRGGEP